VFSTSSTSRFISTSSPKESPKATQKSISFGRMGGKKSLEKEKYSVDVTSSPPDPSQMSPSGWRKKSSGSAGNSILQPDSPSPSSSPSSVQLKENLKDTDSTCLSSSSVQLTGVDKDKDHTTKVIHKDGDEKGDENGDENDPEDGTEDQDGEETLDRSLGPSLLGAARSAELNALYYSPPVKSKASPSVSVSGVSLNVSSAHTDNTIFGEVYTILLNCFYNVILPCFYYCLSYCFLP
jgi:hypothetical protein